jgi:hypothetical protein
MLRKPLLIAAAIAGGALLAVAAPAVADQVFHTSHAAVHPVASAPLRSGFVNDIHTNGVVNAAHEEYHLNGAQPRATYQIELLIYADQSCAGPLIMTVPTATLTTNAAGNGNAMFTFPAGPPNNPPLEVGIVWQFLSQGVPLYATDCVPVAID